MYFLSLPGSGAGAETGGRSGPFLNLSSNYTSLGLYPKVNSVSDKQSTLTNQQDPFKADKCVATFLTTSSVPALQNCFPGLLPRKCPHLLHPHPTCCPSLSSLFLHSLSDPWSESRVLGWPTSVALTASCKMSFTYFIPHKYCWMNKIWEDIKLRHSWLNDNRWVKVLLNFEIQLKCHLLKDNFSDFLKKSTALLL